MIGRNDMPTEASQAAKAPKEDLMTIARRLNALAQSGLFYTKDPFDRERFEEIRALAASLW